MSFTFIDLFAGIGGFSCGFEKAGAVTVAAVEIDPQCRELLGNKFPNAKLFDDVTKVSGDELRAAGFVSERGILTAGWPCQDISVAGRGKGLSGDRSGLFWEVARILRELEPAWFVLENVPRLLSINGGRDMGAVVGALAECGYGFAWRVLDAQHFGIPQRRRRIFFVGHLGDTGTASSEILFESESVLRSAAQDKQSRSRDPNDFGTSHADGSWAAVTASTLQGGGRRGYRIDAEGVSGGQVIVARK